MRKGVKKQDVNKTRVDILRGKFYAALRDGKNYEKNGRLDLAATYYTEAAEIKEKMGDSKEAAKLKKKAESLL